METFFIVLAVVIAIPLYIIYRLVKRVKKVGSEAKDVIVNTYQLSQLPDVVKESFEDISSHSNSIFDIYNKLDSSNQSQLSSTIEVVNQIVEQLKQLLEVANKLYRDINVDDQVGKITAEVEDLKGQLESANDKQKVQIERILDVKNKQLVASDRLRNTQKSFELILQYNSTIVSSTHTEILSLTTGSVLTGSRIEEINKDLNENLESVSEMLNTIAQLEG